MDPILEGYIEESEGTEIISNPQHYLVAEDQDRIQSKRQSTSGVLGAMLVKKYVDLKTVYTRTDIQADMLRIHGISLKYMQAWRALDSNIRGWEYCRPIVLVDGTHLKSTYEGTMLIASTLDPRGHMCFVSDRNKSIWNATAIVYPEFRHYACIYHLWTNLLKKTYRDTEEVRTLLFSLAKAYTVQEFDELMKRMDQINPKYRAYLQKANYEKWSRAHSPVKRTWTLTSNIAESLNNAILVGRRLPVVPLLEFVRKTIEAWNEKHNEEGRNTTTTLTSKYNEMLEDNRNLSHRMLVRASTIHLHTITDGAKRFTVCLNTRMCSCGRFQHDEIPCSHALAAIRHRNKHRDDYCSAYYSNKNYQDTYAIPIEPLPCESTWDVPSHDLEEVVLPPITRKQPGRPPKNDRKKGFTEGEGKKRKLYS
ncbi:uncharacterized protein LOC125861562 [Solanum stenotomum]|uniref:uncharacterized protein LOC125861562 n=1 Tax=Solanum stenotomum TaxID=172797 RepID=UPI0020D1332F|nr:uncharacterized protein LOC125861562 [Solanum stenotomum]